MTAASIQAAPAMSKVPLDTDAVPLSVFLDRTGAVLRAGWPATALVEATVIKVSRNAAGHGLELVDPGCRGAQAGQLRAFLPSAVLPHIRRELGLGFEPEHLNGLTATLRIAPGFDPKWHIQARITGIAQSMVASLAARQLEMAKARLRRDGLFDRQRRLLCPADVTRIGIVHPPGSAGLADVAAEIAAWRKAGLIQPRFTPAPFEGLHAAERLATALREASMPIAGHPPDVVLLLRGGGARNGLLVLDDEPLARTVAGLAVPVITGVGHATDRSLVDAVAYRACDTPSKAIGLVRDLIWEPGRRALAHLSDIRHDASARVEAAIGGAAVLHDRARTGAERILVAAEAACSDHRAFFRVRAEAGRAAVIARETEVDCDRKRLAMLVPIVTDRAALEIDRLRRGIGDAASSRLGTLPDIHSTLTVVGNRATLAVTAAEHEIGQLVEAVESATLRLLDHQEGLLRHAEAGLGDLDHNHVLGRGYALVRDAAGRVLTTRAAAEMAGSFFIEFGDGVLAAVAVSTLPPA